MATFRTIRMIRNRNQTSKILWTTTAKASSYNTLLARVFSSSINPIIATLLPGEGIGYEIAQSVKQVFTAASVPIKWEEHYLCTEIDPRTFFTWESIESVRRNKVGLKGTMEMPSSKGLLLRKEVKFFAKVRPCFSFPGYKTRYDDVDLVIIRENTQGEYNGIEHEVVKGVVECIKVITHEASLRIAEYAFHYAKSQGRKKVSAIHKANNNIIMPKSDGLFLKCCQEVASNYPDIIYEEVVIDKLCMMLVKEPSVFDVLLMPNLYGDIVSNLCSGLVGGIRLTPSCSIGEDGIVLGEVLHDSAYDIAGKNLANPTAMLLSGVMMLRHLKINEQAEQIQRAIIKTVSEGKNRTVDLGGISTTTEFTEAICNNLYS